MLIRCFIFGVVWSFFLNGVFGIKPYSLWFFLLVLPGFMLFLLVEVIWEIHLHGLDKPGPNDYSKREQ